MKPIDVIILIFVISFMAGIIGVNIYRKVKKRPMLGQDCGCSSKGRALVKAYHKEKVKCDCRKKEKADL